ncbi:hypothetical protein J3R83DRAFT_9579 [Lanmaoa asiatica]|nr:hypothetical protein J3R83DRAFT_9579 [Lanmaoa asiatica]
MLYGTLITNFGNYDQVSQVNMYVVTDRLFDFRELSVSVLMRREYVWQGLLIALVALPSQLFFVNRIAKFSGKRWLLFALWLYITAEDEMKVVVTFV